VLHINRVGEDLETKIKTQIELPFHEIELCGKKFVLNAVIRHQGNDATAGHYTIFRKRNSHWETDASKSEWVKIDDHQIFDIDPKNIADHGRNGQSVMLLFKAVENVFASGP
jgi:uncharacterized UBP type Zn finger protein